LTVFTFTESAKYAYRSIARFIQHVTTKTPEHLERNPFPELHLSSADSNKSEPGDDEGPEIPLPRSRAGSTGDGRKAKRKGRDEAAPTSIELFHSNREKAQEEVAQGDAETTPSSESTAEESRPGNEGKDIPGVIFIRERVNIFGRVRPMEPKEEIEALKLRPQEIGVIKEAPVRRWLTGQELWDEKYKHAARKVYVKRRRYEAKAARLVQHAREQGLLLEGDKRPAMPDRRTSLTMSFAAVGDVQAERRWGPLDLADEHPPASAIAGRRDTREAVALLKKSIYHTAPRTHSMIPRLRAMDAIRAAELKRPPQQSASEQQVEANIIPVHGLAIWQSLITYFMHKSSKKASDGKREALAAVHTSSQKLLSGGSRRATQRSNDENASNPA